MVLRLLDCQECCPLSFIICTTVRRTTFVSLHSLDVTELVEWGNEPGLESVLAIIAVVTVSRRPTMLGFRLIYSLSLKVHPVIACTFVVFIC